MPGAVGLEAARVHEAVAPRCRLQYVEQLLRSLGTRSATVCDGGASGASLLAQRGFMERHHALAVVCALVGVQAPGRSTCQHTAAIQSCAGMSSNNPGMLASDRKLQCARAHLAAARSCASNQRMHVMLMQGWARELERRVVRRRRAHKAVLTRRRELMLRKAWHVWLSVHRVVSDPASEARSSTQLHAASRHVSASCTPLVSSSDTVKRTHRSREEQDELLGDMLRVWRLRARMAQLRAYQLEAAAWHRQLVLLRASFGEWFQVCEASQGRSAACLHSAMASSTFRNHSRPALSARSATFDGCSATLKSLLSRSDAWCGVA